MRFRLLLTQAYMREQLVKALHAKADILMGQIRQGKSMEEAAASVGSTVTHLQSVELIKPHSSISRSGESSSVRSSARRRDKCSPRALRMARSSRRGGSRSLRRHRGHGPVS